MLAGTAIVAVSAFGAQAQAVDLTGPSTYGTTAPVNAPTAGIDINLNGENLTINNTSSVAIGAITDTNATPDGNVVIVTSAATDLTQTIGSIDNGTGNFTINNSTNDGDLTVNVTGAFAIGTGTTGNLVVNGDADATDQSADDLVLTVGGNASVAGTTAIDSGDVAGAFTTVNFDGATNVFTGAVTVTGGDGDAANDASLVLSGASNTFTGGLTLTDGAAGQALLLLDGTSAQSVTGTIAGNGDITVTNATGATFNGTVAAGTITVENSAALNSSATFTNTVNVGANAITLGGAGTGANTITFDGTTQAFTVTGALTGAAVGETNTVNVIGGKTITLATATAADNNIDAINVTGTGTTLTSGANVQAAAITVGTGATLSTTGGTVTSAVTNNGTLALGGGAVTGNVTGTGLLDVNANATVTGAITQGTADIAAFTLTQAGGTNAYNVGTTNFSGAGTLALAAGDKAVTGNFTNTTDGQGTITIADGAGTTAITGNLGASVDNSLAALTLLTGATAQTVTTTGNLFVDAITLDSDDTLQFIGSSAQTVSGTIQGRGANEGILTIGNGTTASDVTFNGVIGGADLASATVSALSTARFNANATFDGAMAVAGTAVVGPAAIVEAQNFTGTGTVTLAVSDADTTNALAATDFGRVTDTTAGGTTLTATNFGVDVRSQLATGTVASILTNINLGAATLADNSFQYSFVTADNGADTDITVSRRTLESIADGSKLTTGAAETLDGLVANTDAQIVQINNNLAAASSQEAANDILESVSPTVDAGAVIGATSFVTQTSNITNTQLASLRNGEETGMYAGNITNGLRGWVQGFGLTGDQDDRDGVSGYDVDSYGVAVGMDTQSLVDGWIWGLAFAYSDTDVESDGVNNTDTEIDSYQVSVYSSYDLDDRTYIAGQAGYVWGDNDQTRQNVGGVTGLTAQGDYDSDVIFAGLEAGRRYMVGGNTVLTPKALVNYQHYDADGYTETGAGGANLTVSGEEIDLFEIGVGVDASWDYQQADGSFLQPKIGVGVRHDLIGDEYQTTSTFAAGGASFQTEGFDPAQTTFNVSADLTYFSTTNWELSAGYDFEYKSDYDSHAGTLKAAYKF